MKGKFWRKALAVATSVLMLSGGVPIQPLSQVFEDIAITASAEGEINLSTLGSYTAQDGDVLTGSTSDTVTIADNANITLSDVTITGGIVCNGTAEITLVGENVVGVTTLTNALIYQTPGIKIGSSGTTLTIKGGGSLNASGGSAAAGIGLGRTWDENATAGSVVIESGTVTASGGNGIGIGNVGNSKTAQMDGIIIKGGTVNASLGNGYIYFGSSVTIGAIKIYDGIDKVDASAITESVTYMHDDTDVTANASTYFTIIEDGDRRIIEKKDNTDYSITIADGIEHGSIAYAATAAKYGDKVTITATPDFGYRLSRLIVRDALNNDVESTDNSFFMPKSNVTVSAVFEQGTHGTTEFAWGYLGPDGIVTEASIYDGLTTVNLQQGQSCLIFKYDEYSYRKFLLDNDTYNVTIPYSGGTGTFPEYGNCTDFRVDYNGESGFYDFTMTDVGNDKWSVSIQKTVPAMDDVPDQTYTGSEIKPEPLVLAGSLNLTKGTDYEYSYSDNTNVGTAKVTVTFKGDYASLGSVEKEFNIIEDLYVFDIPAQTYTGSAIEAEVVAIYGKTKLALGTDYTVSYSDNTNAGTAKVIITGIGNYSGTVEKTFTINKATPTVTSPTAKALTYTGSAQELVTAGITDKGTLLYSLDGKTYSEEIPKATDAGTYTVYYKVDTDNYYYAPQPVTAKIGYSDGIGEHLAGHSLSLNGNIGVNFYMELDADVIADPDAYMLFTLPNDTTQTVKVSNATVDTTTVSGKTYYVFQCSVAAKEMTDTIKAQMFSGEKQGEEYSYTVKQYADYLFANAYEADGTTVKNQAYVDAIELIESMVNYGAYSQLYFNHNTDSPANADITATNVRGVTAETVNKTYDGSTNTLPDGVTLAGANLELESETVMNLYFTNTTGKALTFTTSGNIALVQEQSGEYTKVTITGIAAQYLDSDVTVNIALEGDDNAYSVKYSPMNYCYNVLARETTATRTEALKDVMRAFYLYNKEAKAYFASHNN